MSVAIQPPAYTGLQETKAVDPEQLQAIEGSSMVLSIDASAARVSVEQDGRTHVLTRGADGTFTDRLLLKTTGYVLVIAEESEGTPKPAARIGAEATSIRRRAIVEATRSLARTSTICGRGAL